MQQSVDLKKIESNVQEGNLVPTESRPLVGRSYEPYQKICKCPVSEKRKIGSLLLTFGPLYCHRESNECREYKDQHWESVLKTSPDREAVTNEKYLAAMRLVESKARLLYGDECVDSMTGTQFRWMMIKDGCLFLMIVLLLLDDDGSNKFQQFGKKPNAKEIKVWIKNMFFVGNQIPFIVLKELLNQSFFQKAIADVIWKGQSSTELSKKVLYDFLIKPSLDKGSNLVQQQPVDLLHALHLLVVGPVSEHDYISNKEDEEESDDEDEDLYDSEEEHETKNTNNVVESEEMSEQGHTRVNLEGMRCPCCPCTRNEEEADKPMDDKGFLSAVELNQRGINFEVSPSLMYWSLKQVFYTKPIQACKYFIVAKTMGSRGITFADSFLSTALFLPPLIIDDHTELMFRALLNYEISQEESSKKKKEFSSYLRLMKELIQTPDDALLLKTKGIILGNNRHCKKLPKILNKVAPKEAYNHKFRVLTMKVSDYDRPSWKNLRTLLGAISFLTVVQTVYAVVTYHTGK